MSTGLIVSQIISWAVGLTGSAAAIIAFFRIGPERRKLAVDAYKAGIEASEIIAKASSNLLEPYMLEVTELHKERIEWKKEVTSLNEQNSVLQSELEATRREMRLLRQQLDKLTIGDISGTGTAAS